MRPLQYIHPGGSVTLNRAPFVMLGEGWHAQIVQTRDTVYVRYPEYAWYALTTISGVRVREVVRGGDPAEENVDKGARDVSKEIVKKITRSCLPMQLLSLRTALHGLVAL